MKNNPEEVVNFGRMLYSTKNKIMAVTYISSCCIVLTILPINNLKMRFEISKDEK